MSVVILIPARYASSRYPGKPLVDLKGASGVAKPLIRRSWEAAMAVSGVDAVYVATDDARIAAASRAFGAEVVMTAESCRNGTERCFDALDKLVGEPQIVINLQGDAPLTPPWFVEQIISAMQQDPSIEVATPILRCDGQALANFQADRRNGQVGGTTVVTTLAGDALYFSKEVIPFGASAPTQAATSPVFHHVGLYGYRPSALKAYGGWPECELEQLEGLEQLRFLANGWKVRCIEVEGRGRVFWELNNPIDVERVESALARIGLE
ncbi:MAG: 3-deoxy-manno-octulosonate cytidylyltransferase [Neomegalonema sp.]|nr:3-deoxy-manno-octulosonate cytidylyltransferase [Neomegalonema sp.]